MLSAFDCCKGSKQFERCLPPPLFLSGREERKLPLNPPTPQPQIIITIINRRTTYHKTPQSPQWRIHDYPYPNSRDSVSPLPSTAPHQSSPLSNAPPKPAPTPPQNKAKRKTTWQKPRVARRAKSCVKRRSPPQPINNTLPKISSSSRCSMPCGMLRPYTSPFIVTFICKQHIY